MIEYEKKIAQQTLNILMKKSWNTFSLEQALKNVKVKKAYIKTKFDLLKPMIAAFSSIRLFVVFSSLPLNFIIESLITMAPQPPEPGLPLHAPSV